MHFCVLPVVLSVLRGISQTWCVFAYICLCSLVRFVNVARESMLHCCACLKKLREMITRFSTANIEQHSKKCYMVEAAMKRKQVDDKDKKMLRHRGLYARNKRRVCSVRILAKDRLS